jgi:hypothetical protein
MAPTPPLSFESAHELRFGAISTAPSVVKRV